MGLRQTIATNSIKELLLDKYIEILATRNIALLDPTGTASREELEGAWNLVQSEYLEESGELKYQYFLEEKDYVKNRRAIHSGVQVHLEAVRRYWEADAQIREFIPEGMAFYGKDAAYKEHVQFLHEHDYKFEFSRESFADDCKGVARRIKFEEVKLAKREQKRDGMADKTEKSKDNVRQKFYVSIMNIQRILGVMPTLTPVAIAKQITVYEFLVYWKEVKPYLKQSDNNDNSNGT